ncbi:hypothetical protein G7078_10210 [Sphingomonas sinipercae]|uniref:Uncharacterized protein n=1 Tax=Sphingomonas sinipercae TaxID=2714944 RepID=A0A6G7ZQ54_9SPHN|nr:hypothetical protein [Sphingomonas sinipercae]QIL03114.1 hypothetical protein G7078_10210 [Sphingomonas sinipercae]
MDEQQDGVSADLPYELQSKMFDQLAGMSIAAAGLTVTLISSILQRAPGIIWMAVVEFGLAAFIALSGNITMIEAIFTKRPSLKRSKVITMVVLLLMGMGTGTLAMSVYLESRNDRLVAPSAAKAAASTPAAGLHSDR